MQGFIVSLVIFASVAAIFGLGLNLQWGYTGLINFGHVAFMTIGAYTTVLLSINGVPLAIAMLVGAALASLLGLLIGLATLRLRTDYLAIVTIGVAEIIRLVALNERWLTRGTAGLQGFPLPLEDFIPPVPIRIGMIAVVTAIVALGYWQIWKWVRQQMRDVAKQGGQRLWTVLLTGLVVAVGLWIYGMGISALYIYRSPAKTGLMFLSVILLAVIYWGLERLVRSPWGRVLKAIREDEEVARAVGKNVFAYKLQAIMLGGLIAGLAGALYSWQLATVYPDNFMPIVTFDAWTIVVLGGAGSNAGTILGAGIFWAYDTLTRFVLKDYLPFSDAQLGALRIMVIGLLLMVIMVWRPQGILGKKEELTLGR